MLAGGERVVEGLVPVLSSASARKKIDDYIMHPRGRAYKPQHPTILQLCLPSFLFSSSLVDESQSSGQVDPAHYPQHGIVTFFMQHSLSLLASFLLQGFCRHMM